MIWAARVERFWKVGFWTSKRGVLGWLFGGKEGPSPLGGLDPK